MCSFLGMASPCLLLKVKVLSGGGGCLKAVSSMKQQIRTETSKVDKNVIKQGGVFFVCLS